ncbi:unnamed protein product [Agarophyton chilense]
MRAAKMLYLFRPRVRSTSSRFSIHDFTSSAYVTVLGGSLCLFGTSLIAAEHLKQDEQMEHPTRKEYEYLICGGGVAAQEALKTFLQQKQTQHLLLVAPEWRNHQMPLSSTFSTVRDEPTQQDSFLSAIFNRIPFIHTTSKQPEFLIGPSVKSINATNRIATLDNGDEVSFKRCLIAVGSTMPDIPIGKVISHDAERLVSGAQSGHDWERIDRVLQYTDSQEENRAHITVVGGGWMSPIVGASLIEQGADVTFSYSEPSFLARYLPRYVSQDVLARLQWQSDGGVDSLSYSTVRYVVARKALRNSIDGIEAEVHIGTVFDSFSIVDFRTDHIIFAPTMTSKIPIETPNLSQGVGGFTVNAELAVASDVYVAGSAVQVNNASAGHSHIMRWSSDHARSTGRHAAMNMMGGREPYALSPTTTVDLRLVNLQVHVLGNVDGSLESFGYFRRTKNKSEDTCGGHLETGAVVYVTPAPLTHRGAPQMLLVTGIVIWEGSLSEKLDDVKAIKTEAMKLLNSEPMNRPELEHAMDDFATNHLGIAGPGHLNNKQPKQNSDGNQGYHDTHEKVEDGGGMKKVVDPLSKLRSPGYRPSPNIIWRRHKPARTVRIREDEVLWMGNERVGGVSPETRKDRVSKAYSELLRKSAGRA